MAIAALIAAAGVAHAQIVKCRIESGRIAYQEKQCPPGASAIGAPLPSETRTPAVPERPGQAASKPPSGQDLAEQMREGRAGMERDAREFKRRCDSGDPDPRFCVLAICLGAGLDDTDESALACARAHGHPLGNGWYASDKGQRVPGVLRPDWSISITCMQRVNGIRPSATVWRKFEVPESSFDLDAEARKACERRYAQAQRRAKK